VPRTFHERARRTLSAWPVSHGNFSIPFKALTFLRGSAEPAPLNHALWMSSYDRDEQEALLQEQVWRASGAGATTFEATTGAWARSEGAEPLARATHLDALTYLPNDILTKVDRASMRVALEVRAPFLARDVVELAFSVPDSFRMRGTNGKRMLRDAVKDLIPAEILGRPKKGFGIPVAAWLNGPLREMVQDVFTRESVEAAGLFNYHEVRRMLDAHAARKVDYRKPLWTLLVFELWRREYLA